MKCSSCDSVCEVCNRKLDRFEFDQVIQIIPLSRIVQSVYENKDGIFTDIMDIITLSADGTIRYMYSDDSGCFQDASETTNFLGYWYKEGIPTEAWIEEKKEERNKLEKIMAARRKKELEKKT